VLVTRMFTGMNGVSGVSIRCGQPQLAYRNHVVPDLPTGARRIDDRLGLAEIFRHELGKRARAGRVASADVERHEYGDGPPRPCIGPG